MKQNITTVERSTEKVLADRRVNKVIVFDTETAPLYKGYGNKRRKYEMVFDFGYTIANKQGRILIKRNWVIREIFTNMNLMKHAFYFEKYPLYLEKINNGEVKFANWAEAISQLELDLVTYNIHELYAYNIAFDKRAIEQTHYEITGRRFYLWQANDLKLNCLWGMACETFLQQKRFIKTAINESWTSPTGNIRTNAETAYRFIEQNYLFEESHTALDDAIIETAIMAKCFRTHRHMSFGIISQPWRLVKATAQTMGLLPMKGGNENA